MARAQWYKAPKNESFDGIDTIKLKDGDDEEWEINSPYGYIYNWDTAKTKYVVVITNNRYINRYANDGHRYVQGEEKRLIIPATDLHKWATILKMKKNRSTMVSRANAA